MKLAMSTGDYYHHVPTITKSVKNFEGSKSKYINLEQPGIHTEFFSGKHILETYNYFE